MLMLLASGIHAQSVRDEVGYTRLQTLLGANTPDGRDITVGVIEPIFNDGSWMPARNKADTVLTDKIFDDKSIQTVASATSSHATQVSKWLLSNNESIAPGISNADFYNLEQFAFQHLPVSSNTAQNPISRFFGARVFKTRVNNFSAVGDTGRFNGNILRRFDWATASEDTINVISAGNSVQSSAIFGSSYNGIYVGITAGTSGQRSAPIDYLYNRYRQRPDVVAPMRNTSRGTAVVTSIMTSLTQAANNSALSQSGLTHAGDTIFNAERSETMKAIIMAGANRNTNNGRINNFIKDANGDAIRDANNRIIETVEDITDYRKDPKHRTANGLDSRYGAGQVDIYNSHQILAAGEQDSREDGGNATVGKFGFDYDDEFGLGITGHSANSTASYLLPTLGADAMFISALAWNADISADGGAFIDGILYDLDLWLYDVTGNSKTLVAFSASGNANTESIWQLLLSGHQYELRVTTEKNVLALIWDYAIAWRIEDLQTTTSPQTTTAFSNLQTQAVPLPTAGWLFISGFLSLLTFKKYNKKGFYNTLCFNINVRFFQPYSLDNNKLLRKVAARG